jgi:hypothetical protein
MGMARRSRYIDSKPDFDWSMSSEIEEAKRIEKENERREKEMEEQVPAHLRERAQRMEQQTINVLMERYKDQAYFRAAAGRLSTVKGIIKYHEDVMGRRAPDHYYVELGDLINATQHTEGESGSGVQDQPGDGVQDAVHGPGSPAEDHGGDPVCYEASAT